METDALGHEWYLSIFCISWLFASQEASRIAMNTHLAKGFFVIVC